MSAEVRGYAAGITWAGGEGEPEIRDVDVPENALPALGEGFCPACAGVPLAGDTGTWCPSCRVHWRVRREG